MRKTKYEKGSKVCEDLLDGKIEDFEDYLQIFMYEGQTATAAYSLLGEVTFEYIKTLEDESNKTKIIDLIFQVKNFNKIPLYRIARDISTKYEEYFENPKKKRYYLNLHRDVRERDFTMAMIVAGLSSLSKKYSGIQFTPSEYVIKCQNA